MAVPLVGGESPDDGVVAALTRLSEDTDGDLRDWAAMGLGAMLDVDNQAIRDALAARLDDQEGDTAGEALLGLALRKDPSALAPLLAWLDDQPGNLIVEGAAALGSPEALPALLRLKEEGWQTGEARPAVLDEAIEACSE
jgi:HEAT repeat protein